MLDSLPKVDADGVWRIPEEELAKRRDLRKEQIFSIDPPTARDLDDALSWRTALSGSISTVLTGLSWICVGIHSRGALRSPVCA